VRVCVCVVVMLVDCERGKNKHGTRNTASSKYKLSKGAGTKCVPLLLGVLWCLDAGRRQASGRVKRVERRRGKGKKMFGGPVRRSLVVGVRVIFGGGKEEVLSWGRVVACRFLWFLCVCLVRTE
jgi:hypothetical protein